MSSAGLWDAETMIPAAKSPVPARNARAGVGTQPATWTSTPRLVAPAVIAATNMSPERRVSWPTTIAPPWPDELVGGRPAEGVGEGRLEVDVGDAADPVGAEEAGHRYGAADGVGGGARDGRDRHDDRRRVDRDERQARPAGSRVERDLVGAQARGRRPGRAA